MAKLTYQSIVVSKTNPPREGEIDPIISGEVNFSITSKYFNATIRVNFVDCPGEPLAKARAFQDLEDFAQDVLRAVRAERAVHRS